MLLVRQKTLIFILLQGWKRYVPDETAGQFNFNFHGNVMSFKDEAGMSKTQADLFRESCFGQFLDMPSITRSSKILSTLMLRTGYLEGVEKSNSRLLIDVGGHPREFTRKHFSDITGLHVEEGFKLTHSNAFDKEIPGGLYMDTFKGGVLATRANIAALVKDSQQWTDDEKRVRFLLIHFLYSVLLPGQRTVAIKNKSFIKMVDNPCEFNGFPWGNVVWDHFMASVLSFIQKAQLPCDPEKTKKVHVEGFLLPLQIWAYECIPKLSLLGLCDILQPTATPLMLRWSASAKVKDNIMHAMKLDDVSNFLNLCFMF